MLDGIELKAIPPGPVKENRLNSPWITVPVYEAYARPVLPQATSSYQAAFTAQSLGLADAMVDSLTETRAASP